ncbi:hypothetical protein [Streptomyces sp. NPDC017524]|uniref:hypothetical protein n=1 Tax=Streptomyces sp. NPDC017524 TaxID=3364999 RepID=UPI0037B5E252
MIEILDDLDVLYQGNLDLTTVEMGGVALGAPDEVSAVPRLNGELIHQGWGVYGR